MLMDIFICTEEAKGSDFFDIDCNTDCWDNIHMLHAIFASFALVIIIPSGMYVREKFQELPSDLNILTSPTFIFVKAKIIIFMIVASKLFKGHANILVACLSIGMLSIVGLHIKI